MGKIHFLNVGCADCTIIQSANHTIIVDCAEGIAYYSDFLPSDKKIEVVFITHQHYDHFKGLGYLKDNGYSIGKLIYSPYLWQKDDDSVRRIEWKDFEKYKGYFQSKGAKMLYPYRQETLEEPLLTVDGIKFFILGPIKHLAQEQRHIHDGCLVILAELGERKCLFTGDASNKTLRYIAIHTRFHCDDILHASHHGSCEGAEETFIQKCNPAYTVISTGPSVHPFPQPAAMGIYKQYTREEIYRTDEAERGWSMNW